MSLLELCESLAVPQANERKAIDLMFEREMKQEKNLEVSHVHLLLDKHLLACSQQIQISSFVHQIRYKQTLSFILC